MKMRIVLIYANKKRRNKNELITFYRETKKKLFASTLKL